MPLTITDEQLAQTGLTADDLRTEIAVALRDRNLLSLFLAAEWAEMEVRAFGDLLRERGVPWFDAGSGDPEEYFGPDPAPRPPRSRRDALSQEPAAARGAAAGAAA